MFRRTKPEEPAPVTPPKPGGKGRPTPTRKEAEAAARARAKGTADKKAAAKLLRDRRAEENARMRTAMKTGDERYLPARDRGKVRRFVRDRVDSRISAAEFLLPLLFVVMALVYSDTYLDDPTVVASLVGYGNSLWMVTLLLVVADTLLLTFRIKRDLRARFPDESHKGVVFYAVLRAMQLRFLRLPKPKVKIGERLPERY